MDMYLRQEQNSKLSKNLGSFLEQRAIKVRGFLLHQALEHLCRLEWGRRR